MSRRHGKDTVVYLDGYDLSGDSNALDVSSQLDTAETSGFVNKKSYTPGQIDSTANWNGWFDTGVDSINDLLEDRLDVDVVFCAAYGKNQDDWGWGGSGKLVKTYSVQAPLGGAVSVTASLQFSDTFESIQVALPKGTAQGTASGTVDSGAASSDGVVGYLQVFEVLGGTPVFAIQHSSTGTSAWTDKVVFTGVTDVSAERVEASGAVSQYLRVNVTNGSAVAFVGYGRN